MSDRPSQPKSRIHFPGWLAHVVDRAREERGQALVEFALIGTVFLMILFGIAQFGLALNSANDETHLANEVARYAAVNYNPSSGQSLLSWVKSTQSDSNMMANGSQICVSFLQGSDGNTGQVGDPIQVTVSTTMNWLPILGVGPSTTVTGKAVMRIEASPVTVVSNGQCA
jgi:Flp pilus assembly protein TadG